MSNPLNIQRLVRQNDQHVAATAYANNINQGSAVSAWHEKKFQKANASQLTVKTADFSFKETSVMQRHAATAKEQIGMELRMANAAVKLERAARMKDLFERETLAYEAELNAKGLALKKYKD